MKNLTNEIFEKNVIRLDKIITRIYSEKLIDTIWLIKIVNCYFIKSSTRMSIEKKDVISSLIEKSMHEIEQFDEILHSLPIGVTIQSLNRVILYENLFHQNYYGSYQLKKCYERWSNYATMGEKTCNDCPVTSMLREKKPIKIYRKSKNNLHEPIYLEIQVFPIFRNEHLQEITRFVETITSYKLS